MSDASPALTGFQGTVRLFPLPNLVFFPNAVQPLHIFEPRYRQMTADALAGDNLIALALLRDGWEKDYSGRPAVHSVGCVGRIVSPEKLPDGRYNFLLHGLKRVRILHELPDKKPYRLARVELLEDGLPPAPARAGRLRKDLGEQVLAWLQAMGIDPGPARELFGGDQTLNFLCDLFTFHLPLPADLKQRLLEELSVERRTAQLIEHLRSQSPPPAETAARKFPPEFSQN